MTAVDAQIKLRALAWLSLAVCGPVSVMLMIKYYGGVPEQLQEFRETYVRESTETKAELRRLTAVTEDQTEAIQSLIPMRERISLIEQAQKQHGAEINRLEQRVDKLEDRPSLFGGSKK